MKGSSLNTGKGSLLQHPRYSVYTFYFEMQTTLATNHTNSLSRISNTNQFINKTNTINKLTPNANSLLVRMI